MRPSNLRVMSRRAIPLLVAGVLALAAGCGDDGDSAADAAGNGVDRAFAAAMVPHHQSAIEMSAIAERRADSRFVKQLASAIAHVQEEEIAVLRREDRDLAARGVERGDMGVAGHMMGMDDDPATLRTAEDFDKAFLEMMIPHHAGAVTMARAELAKGTDPDLRDLAQRIITAQEREIGAMRDQLATAQGGAAASSPDGGQAEGHSAG
jgi:uncharacterized protein (DUF305 family)